ncbi:MAG TPA: hypothetical protein PLJ18_11995 [Niabella sp.]|nr:hypothetical protein [Niabella sp.]
MKFRYTINELQNTSHENYMSDLKLLRSLCNERKSTCTNVYSPLHKRLQALENTLSNAIDNNKTITFKP